VIFTCTLNLPGLNAAKDEVRDVPLEEAMGLAAAGVAALFDDLPPEPEPEVVEVKRPYTNAPKADWVEYAVAQGANKLDAQCMTKAELQNQYNDRL
jgi:hypothetical protein